MSEAKRSRPDESDQASTLDRRGFLSIAIGFVLSFAYLGTALRFLYPPSARTAETQKVGRPDDFVPGKPRLVTYTGAGVGDGVYIVRREDHWDAFDLHCTHLECPVGWYERTGEFLCPCHGSSFDISGRNLGGPAPGPLRRHLVEVRGDGVYVGGLIT